MCTWENSGALKSGWHFQENFLVILFVSLERTRKNDLLGLDRLNWRSLGYPCRSVDWAFVNIGPGVRTGFQS